jgi:hypothetical protein
MPSLHYMYMYTPPSIQIHVHGLPKFDPKTSWRYLNALAIKSHNFSLVKLVQHFLFILLTMKQFGTPNLGIFFSLIFVQMKQIKA